MRVTLSTALVLAILIATGCGHSGDCGEFLITEVTRYGGHTITNATFPKIDARWMVEHDSNGFTARIRGVQFTTVDTFMREAFGSPKISTDKNLDGQPHNVWGAVDIGVAIQCIGRTDGVEIICVKGKGMPFR